jgi:hypothetical protein
VVKVRISAFGLVHLLAIILLGLAIVSVVWASSSNGAAVDWDVLSGGGAPITGGTVTMNSTLGQMGIGPSGSAHIDLGAGFWYGLGEGEFIVYLPILMRNP